MRILIVDDRTDMRTGLVIALEQAGHEVVPADSGRDGVRLLRRLDIDVVISKILMPVVDGLEVIKAARSRAPSPWIVAVSGDGRYLSASEALTMARALGADRILYEPFRNEDLLEAIEK